MFLVADKKGGEVAADASGALAYQDKIPWVYHARGLAIMLIVYRHIVLGMQFSGVPVSQFMFNLQMVFFNFRMPAFFLLSGVFLAKSLEKRSEKMLAGEKVRTLLYPYIIWCCITLFLQITFDRFSNAQRSWGDFVYIITQPRELDQMWYLLALFNTSILYLLLKRLIGDRILLHILIALGLHYFSFFIQPYSLFSDFCYFYLYFLSGALLSQILLNAEKRDRILSTSNLKWVLPLFILGQWFWFMNKSETGTYEFLFIIINYIGVYVLFMLALIMSQGGRNAWLTWIGRYSLYIYILHVQVAAIVRKLIRDIYEPVNPWILLVFCFACGIVIPILLVRYLRRFGIEHLFTLKTPKKV